MNGITESCLIGLQLLETDGFQPNAHKENDCLVLGSVICPSLSVTCYTFRNLLLSKLPFVPLDFRFLSKNRWPIEKTEEDKVKVSELLQSGLVTIQRYFDLPRLGIRWLNGKFLGFVFINFNSNLVEARRKILSDLADKFHLGNDFEFLERNEWPVASTQETDLNIWDICVANYCVINKISSNEKSDINNHKAKKRPLKLNDKQKSNKRLSFQTYSPNSILISYVHCEASTHARNLKDELRTMGFDKVFLDVDDIPAGQDWQDVINTALNNCNIFVPLVTPKYGETRWTNREAKLADEKEKVIIPISFLEKWPPDQLAIQFLSLQYIPWKTKEDNTNDEHDFTNDIISWDQRCVHRVAKEIEKLFKEQEVSTPDSLSLLDGKPHVGSVPFLGSKKLEHSKDSIVISAHCLQKSFVENIMNLLEKEGFDAWSSTDMAEFNEDIASSFDDSQISEPSPILDSYCHKKEFSSYTFSANSKGDDSPYGNPKGIPFQWKTSEFENLRSKKSQFKQKIKESSLVIVVMSEDYIANCICKQQAFYCEQRRKVIVIKYGEFEVNNTILKLYPEQDMLKFTDNGDIENLFTNIKSEVTRILGDTARESYKDQIQTMVAKLSSQLNVESSVYVIGGVDRVSTNAKQFCINLGQELAKMQNLTLVTEGFFGVGDLVGRSICEEREIRNKGKPTNVFHVIPHKDSNITARARQSENGYFLKVPFGQTLFFGNSISERDDIVSSTFKICILIEGGGRSACLAEKFLCDDCIVIPVIFNSHIISSKQCLKENLFRIPCGVQPSDWSELFKHENPDRAQTVKKIVKALLKARKGNQNGIIKAQK